MKKAVVISCINVDICGKSGGAFVSGDSNPGKVTRSLGGVGFNIARNLALAGVGVGFLGAIGQDANTGSIIMECSEFGIDISHVMRLSDCGNSTFLYICDSDGEMVGAVNDMGISLQITESYIERNLEFINAADCVVIDANLPERTVAFIAANCRPPIFADGVSCAKVGKLDAMLGSFYALKVNEAEYGILNNARRCARVYVTSGSAGARLIAGEGIESGPAIPGEVVNVTGGGDAFLAGVIFAFLVGKEADSLRIALEFASAAVSSPETISLKIIELAKKYE
jgi:pseudouridine kinase